MQNSAEVTSASRSKAARVFVPVFIAVQVLVPGAMLAARWVNEGSQPATEYPVSWQMYSATKSGTYEGTTEDGSTVQLSTDSLPPVIRAQGYYVTVPLMLCEENESLVSVRRVDLKPSQETGDIAC